MSVEILVAVASGVLGMALPAVLEGGPLASLICSIVGMSVRPFVMTAGRRRRLRITTTVLVTLSALGLQYAGTTFIVSPLAGQEILPGSDVLIAGQDPPPPPNGIELTPAELVCEPGCNLNVTIKNPGNRTAKIDDIEFTGLDKSDFRYEGKCKGKALAALGECSFVIGFKPSDPTLGSEADLSISHSLPGSPLVRHVTSKVTENPQGRPDLRVGTVACTYAPTSTLKREGALVIGFSMTLTGSAENLPEKIAVTATKEDGKINRATASVPGKVSVSLPITERDYGEAFDVVILVDSDHAVKEANEQNNSVQVTVSPPKKPNVKQTLNCST